MAGFTTPDPWDAPAPEGAFVPEPPRQGPIDYVRDTLLDVGRGFIGVGTSASALAGDRDATDFGNALSWKLGQLKSERGQYVEEHPEKSKGGFTDEVVQAGLGVLPYIAPTVAATAAGTAVGGPVGGFVAPTAALTGLTVGDSRAKLRDQIRYAREEEIIKSPVYQQARAEGMTDEQARDRVYDVVSNDPSLMITAGIAGAIGGGVASRVAGKFMSKSVADTITQRVMQSVGAVSGQEGRQAVAAGFQREAAQAVAAKRAQLAAGEITQKEFDAFTRDLASRWSMRNAAIGAGEAFVGGFGQMAPQHYAEQDVMARQGMGDAPTVAGSMEHALKPALAFGVIGAVSHARRRGGTYTSGEPARRPADRMGEELGRTAEQQLGGNEYGFEQEPSAPPPRPGQQMHEGDLGIEPPDFRQRRWDEAATDPYASEPQTATPEGGTPFTDFRSRRYGFDADSVRTDRTPPEQPAAPGDIGDWSGTTQPPGPPPPPGGGGGGGGMPAANPRWWRRGWGDTPDQPGAPVAPPEASEYGPARTPQRASRRSFPRQMRVEDITPDASLDRYQMLRNDRSGAGEALLRRQDRLEQQAREESGIEASRADPQHDALYDYIESQPHLKAEHDAIRRGIDAWEKSEAGVAAAREALVERRRKEAAEARGETYEPKVRTSQGKGKAKVQEVRAKKAKAEAPVDAAEASNVAGLYKPNLHPALAHLTNDELGYVYAEARKKEHDIYERWKKARDRKDDAEMRRLDREMERHANFADELEMELDERKRVPTAAEARRLELLAQPKEATARTGAETMQALGVSPHPAGKGEERLLPEAANLRAQGLLKLPPGAPLRARSPFLREITALRPGLSEKALRVKATSLANEWVREQYPSYGKKGSILTPEQQQSIRKQKRDYADQMYQYLRTKEGAEVRGIEVERRGLPPRKRVTAQAEKRRAAVEALRERGRQIRQAEIEKQGIRTEIMPPTTPAQRAEAVVKRKQAAEWAIERRKREVQHEAEMKDTIDRVSMAVFDVIKAAHEEAKAERESRTGAERHRNQMAEEYAAREKMAKEAATTGNSPEALNALMAGVRGADGKMRPKSERDVLRAFANAAANRVRAAVTSYAEWERKRVESGRKPRIRLGVANRTQFHLWHDRIAFYNKFASDARAAVDKLAEAEGRNNRTAVIEARKLVSRLISDFYDAEGMLHSDRVGEWHQAQYKEANKRREGYERDLLARIKAIDPKAHDEAARSLEQVHLPSAAELGLTGDEAEAYRTTVETRRDEYEGLMRSIGELEEERMSAGEARTVSLFETREEAAALDEAEALSRSWGSPMAWRNIPDVYSMRDPAVLRKARAIIDDLLPSDELRAKRGLPPMDPEVRERIKREVMDRVDEMRKQNAIEEDRQRGEDLEAQRKGGVPERVVGQQANVEGVEYGAEMTRHWSQHMADRYAEEARLREREREAEDAQNDLLATQWSGGVRRDNLPVDHPAYLTLDGLRDIEREAKAAYSEKLKAPLSERTTAAADRARREWFTLNADERNLLRRYEDSHVTSVNDHLSIKEKVEFQRGLEERIRALAEAKKKDPEHFLQDFMQDRGLMLTDRARQLFDALDMVKPNFQRMSRDEMLNLHGEMRRAMGEPPLALTRITPDVIMRDMERASAQLERIETEMRKSWELQQRVGLVPEYGVKALLDPNADLTSQGTVPRGAHVTTVGKYFGNASSTYGMRDAFRVPSNGRMVDGVRSSFIRHFMDVANKVVGHIEVVHVTDEQMRLLAGERKLPPETPSFYDPLTDRIFVTHEVMKSSQRGRVMVHEVAHALTESAMQKFPAVIQRFEEIRRAVKAAYNNPKHEAHEAVRLTLGDHPQALENVHEFVSEFWANDKVSLALGELETTGAQRARWQTKRRETALSKMVFAIKSALMKAFGVGSQKKMLNDATVAALDMLQRFEERGRQRPFITDETRARPMSEFLNDDGQMPRYKPLSERPMSAGEKAVWDRSPVVDIDTVLRNYTREERASRPVHDSFAIDEQGNIHDVGEHYFHARDILRERHNDPRFEDIDQGNLYLLDQDASTGRPWVHISKFEDTKLGLVSLGIERSSHQRLTPAMVRTLNRLNAEVRKTNRDGERVMLELEPRNEFGPEGQARPAESLFAAGMPDLSHLPKKLQSYYRQMFERNRQYLEANRSKVSVPMSVTTGGHAIDYLRKNLKDTETDRLLRETIDAIEPLVRDINLKTHRGNTVPGSRAGGFYTPATHRIETTRNASIVVHELVHAATSRAMERNPEFQKAVAEIMREAINGGVAFELMKKWKSDENFRFTDYYMKNAQEFVAEFMSNPATRAAFDNSVASKALLKKLKMIAGGKPSLMKVLWNTIAKYLRIEGRKGGATHGNLTSAVLQDVFRAQERELPRNLKGKKWEPHPEAGTWNEWYGKPYRPDRAFSSPERAHHAPAGFDGGRTTVTRISEATLDKMRDLGEGIAKFGFLRNLNEHMRRIDPALAEKGDRIADILGRTQSEQAKIEAQVDRPVLRSLLEALHKGDPNIRSERLLDYMNTERYAKVFGSSELHQGENAWVERDNPMHQQSIYQHRRVREMWNRLTPEEQAVVKQTRGAMAQRHEDILNTTLNSLIKNSKWLENQRPAAVEAVRKMIRGEELTDAENRALDADLAAHPRAEFDEWVGEMKSIPAFRKIEGPYYPLMRHGDFIVSGRYDLRRIIDDYNRANPGDRIAGREGDRENRWEFGSNAERDRFIRFVSEHPEFQFNITSAGNEHVVVNTDHFSAHEHQRDAERELAELQADPTGGRYFIPRVVTRRRDTGIDYGPRNQGMHAVEKLVTSLKNSSYYRSLDPVEQNIMVRNIEEIGYRSMLSSAVRANIATRRYVRGASEDLARNVTDYLHKTSYVLAEQRLQPERMKAVADFTEEVRQREWMKDPVTGNPRDDMHQYGTKRSQYHREFLRRAALRPEERNKTVADKVVNTLLRLTSLAKLGSPSYHIMNSFEPGILATPQLAGEHGAANASREMAAAYGIFGGHFVRNMGEDIARVWREGIKGDPELVDHTKSITERIREKGVSDAEDLVRMIDFMDQTGYLHRDAGMDIAKHYDPNQNWAGRMLDYVDNYQRAIGNAVEAQNRATTAIAAYRLERAAGKNHDEAVRYAQRTLEKTAGLYARYNKPEMMNSANPAVRMATQFRNYSIRSIQNYMLMTLGAYHHLRGNETNPEIAERNRLLARQLARQMAVQGLASGLMGSMFWAPVTGATNLTSLITGYNSDDLEHDIRAAMTDVIGKDATMFATRGALRLIGADFGGGLGERLSASSPLTYGTLGDKPDNWFAAAGHIIGGASADTMVKAVTGSQKILDGLGDYANGRYTIGGEKVMKGMSELMPVKAVADVIKVAQRSAYGDHAPSGAPYPEASVSEVASNLLGFRTGTQVERQEAKTYFNREKRNYEADALDIKRAFAMEQDPEARADIINRQRKEFNAGLPEAMQLSREDMLKFARQYAKQQAAPPSQLGLPVTRRTRPLAAGLNDVYRLE